MIFTSGQREVDSIVETCGDSSLGVSVIPVALGRGAMTKKLQNAAIRWCDNKTKLVSNIMDSK